MWTRSHVGAGGLQQHVGFEQSAVEIDHEPTAREATATTTETGPRKARGRRFVLPPLDEDQDRSAAAIEAFLDGSLPPGAFTAILAGKYGGTGLALVEIYTLL